MAPSPSGSSLAEPSGSRRPASHLRGPAKRKVHRALQRHASQKCGAAGSRAPAPSPPPHRQPPRAQLIPPLSSPRRPEAEMRPQRCTRWACANRPHGGARVLLRCGGRKQGEARGAERNNRGGAWWYRQLPQERFHRLWESAPFYSVTENCCVFTQLLFCNSRVQILSRSHLIHRSHQPLCGAGCTLCASFIQSFCWSLLRNPSV